MPAFITLTSDDLEAFAAQIGASSDILRNVSGTLVAKAGQDTREYAQRYPAKNTRTRQQAYGQTFVSDRQRRFFFAALRSGAIQVPYQRTGSLGNNWLLRLNPGAGTYSIELYNDSPYRRFVQGYAKEQARIHAGRWPNQEQIEEYAVKATEQRTVEASNELERLFLIRLGR